MPNFTVELRSLVEDGEDIGLNDYPIFKSEYRDILNKKITDHYWFYEIGHETHFMFARQMRTKMNEIMPYYNQLYETELIKFDPFMTMQVTTENSSENKMDSEAKADILPVLDQRPQLNREIRHRPLPPCRRSRRSTLAALVQ